MCFWFGFRGACGGVQPPATHVPLRCRCASSATSSLVLVRSRSRLLVASGLRLVSSCLSRCSRVGRAGGAWHLPDATGAAMRRRQRRLRSWLRHDRMTVAMALAKSTHHTSRGQKHARAGVWGHEQNYTAKIRKPPHTPAGALQPRRRDWRGPAGNSV